MLVALVSDGPGMAVACQNGQAIAIFEACLRLLADCYAKNPMSEAMTSKRQPSGKILEAASRALWGVTHHICHEQRDPAITKVHIEQLCDTAICSSRMDGPTGANTAYALAATLATLSSNARMAQLLMDIPDNMGIRALLLLTLKETEQEVVCHVRAAAATALSFLSGHPIGACGDDCLTGPHRKSLVAQGAFTALLRAACTADKSQACGDIIELASSVGVMYLSTAVSQLSLPE
eukprot:jgi/Botrbrau1/11707/Bobra.0195s0036.1